MEQVKYWREEHSSGVLCPALRFNLIDTRAAIVFSSSHSVMPNSQFITRNVSPCNVMSLYFSESISRIDALFLNLSHGQHSGSPLYDIGI